MRTKTWFLPLSRTGDQIAEVAEQQLRAWGTELTTQQMTQMAVVATAMRSAIVLCTRSVHLEVTISLSKSNTVTVEMVERAGAELPKEPLVALDSSDCRWGVVPKPRGPGCVLWAAVELHATSRLSDAATRLARTSQGRALRRALPAPLERTARRWLVA
ncbi:hypothetical protein [Streptacidiphilus sp. MAP12-33]|uniref:hypothetical protein n=1 Tax=Streptacidiphilus sp. MAP12-33 TaxID=3156266 RepID=UPI003513A3C8